MQAYVFVINKDGQPLMPTQRYGKIRRLLRDGQAKVVKRCPFTIQLLYETTDVVQPVDLGIDTGYKHIGVSACTEKKELYAADMQVRTDISKNLEQRRVLRRARRNRKTRYRKPRFNNRVRSKHKGWLAPSVEATIGLHIRVIHDVCKILPITSITLETAAFDTQKMQNAEISGVEYQQGTLMGYTIRGYLAEKFNHCCAYCGKTENSETKFEVEHVVPKARGGSSRISNLVWACHGCNEDKGTRTAAEYGHPEVQALAAKGGSMRSAAAMSVMKWYLYNRVKTEYDDAVRMTYGADTATKRYKFNLQKDHHIDARCISGHPNAIPSQEVYYMRKIRCHNRQLHRLKINKGGTRRNNQVPYEVWGIRLFDKVIYQNRECFVFGRRNSGSMDIRLLNGAKVNAGVSYKKLSVICKAGNIILERKVITDIPCLWMSQMVSCR